jgi:hypothetical protein
MINSQENELGDESSSNYTFGDAHLNGIVMRVEMIGEDNDEIPSDGESQ